MKRSYLIPILFLGFAYAQAVTPPYPLTPSQIKFGETQLEQMLRDRPAMAKYCQKGDKVWNWTVQQFAGEWAEGGIEWDPTDPVPLWDAMYYRAEGNRKARVQMTVLSASKIFHFWEPKEGPELWFELIFELSNLQMLDKNDRINGLVRSGKIGKEEYCFRKTLLETVDTRQLVHNFFMDLWVPNCQMLSLEPWDEFMKTENNVGIPLWSVKQFIDEYFCIDYSHPRKDNAYDENFSFHREFFGKQYDDGILPWIKKAQIATPTPMAMEDLKSKLTVEISTEEIEGK